MKKTYFYFFQGKILKHVGTLFVLDFNINKIDNHITIIYIYHEMTTNKSRCKWCNNGANAAYGRRDGYQPVAVRGWIQLRCVHVQGHCHRRDAALA